MRVRAGFAIAAALLITAAQADAQEYALDRGSLQISGSASLTSTDNDNSGDDGRVTVASVLPGLHYFVAEGLGVGGDLIFSYTSSGDDFSTRSIGIGPSVSYYFGGSESRVHPYLSARAAIASMTFDSPGGELEGSRRSGTVAGGILAMLSSSVGVTTELFYLLEKFESQGQEADSNTFGLAVGIAAFVF